MKHTTWMLASAAAIALAGCSHKAANDTAANDTAMATDTNTATDANTTATMGNSAAPAANTGQAFANMAAASDAFEVATSKLALTNSQSPAVKKFANQMITAHTASTAKLKAITAGLTPPITPDPTLNAEQQQKLADLQGKKGADFDQAYTADQIAGHQLTLDTLRGYANTGDVPQLKTFASGLAPTVAAHLNLAHGLEKH